MISAAQGIPCRLAVFDCDGTLVDSQHAIVATMVIAFGAHGLPDPSAEAIRRTIGLPLQQGIARLAPAETPEVHADLADTYRDSAQRNYADGTHEAPLFPGVAEVLDVLSAAGVLLGVATGKGLRGLTATLSDHALNDRFVTLQTADSARGKPHPEMLLRAMSETGARPAHTVMIGDTVYDVEMARNAGVAAIGVSWGYHSAAELREAGAALVIDDFSELPVGFDTHTATR